MANVPDGYARGEMIVDSATDLETNASKGLHPENTLLLTPGLLPDHAFVRMAQTFRSGTNDIDAIDFIEMFLENDTQETTAEQPDVYVLSNFRPAVTKSSSSCAHARGDMLPGEAQARPAHGPREQQGPEPHGESVLRLAHLG